MIPLWFTSYLKFKSIPVISSFEYFIRPFYFVKFWCLHKLSFTFACGKKPKWYKPSSCFPSKCCQFGYERSWLCDLIFLSICSCGFCIGQCHLACHKFISLSFWGLLNAGWHQHHSYAKPLPWVICQCIIKSNTSCVIHCLKQTKLEKFFPSVLYLKISKSSNKRTCLHLFTDLHEAKIWLRKFLYRCHTNVSLHFFKFLFLLKATVPFRTKRSHMHS